MFCLKRVIHRITASGQHVLNTLLDCGGMTGTKIFFRVAPLNTYTALVD
jgi:hypothetical protein